MHIRVEPFVKGFMTGLKSQMTPADHKLVALIFNSIQAFDYSSRDERNPAHPAYYFRFQRSHYNVLLPVWLLNNKKSTREDRFRIGSTADHSVIVDTREKIVYDPTVEVTHLLPEYEPFRLSSQWKDEALLRLRDEISARRFKLATFSERLESLPLVYTDFVAFVMTHQLKAAVPDFRFHIQVGGQEDRAWLEKQRTLTNFIMAELWRRTAHRVKRIKA